MSIISVKGDSKIVRGHVLDVSVKPLLSALRQYDKQLYVKWNPKKRSGRGLWELRRKPEFKSVREGRFLDTPFRGRVFFPGDIHELDTTTISVPKYHENHVENHVKDFDHLTYDMVEWVSNHDLFKYGYRGKDALNEADYRGAKFDEKIDEAADDERQYELKQMRTQINGFREYVLSGGNPYRLLDYWK